jgi:transcriptional regulator with XRE-family HTH domain
MLNEALRLVRVFHDMSQSQLAERLEISKSYLSEIESGKKSPSLDILDKYSAIFDIPVSSILLFSERMKDNSLPEKTRVFVASKIIKIMNWVSETEDVANANTKKKA